MEANQMVVQLRGIEKRYRTAGRDLTAVDHVELQLDAGELVAVCGPSGCGKSTLLLMTGGLLKPDSGTVLIQDQSLYELNASERARFRAQTIGFVFQQFHLVPYLSVLDNVLAARLGFGSRDRQASLTRATSLIEQLGLTDRTRHRPAQLSTGERQRTAMARAMLNSPKLLLADEPTGNLDRQNADLVLEQLRSFSDAGGCVMLVTHDDHAADHADRIVHLRQGALAAT